MGMSHTVVLILWLSICGVNFMRYFDVELSKVLIFILFYFFYLLLLGLGNIFSIDWVW